MLIRTLSLFLLSGLAFAAPPSFPVLTYSTYLRDAFTPTAIATDLSGNIYIAGNAIVGSQTTVLVVKLNPQASQYLYAHYLSGSASDYATGLAVDQAGSAYVTGWTTSPDFPVTGSGNLGTEPDGKFGAQSYVAKLDPSGNLVFSDLFGGSGYPGTAVAVNAAGQIVVTGMNGPALPSSPGVYSVPNPSEHPFLFELDPTGAKIIFSATGIGGSAIALDASGNIYVAGSTTLLDYPTTPGAYQTAFPISSVCSSAPCQIFGQGYNQYVTKVDPTGSKLIYSTAVSGSGNTTNAGLAVDAAGEVFLTGYTTASYPFTVTPPVVSSVGLVEKSPALPFLSKLDALGHALLFSVPIGGAGVQIDSNGAVNVGGGIGVVGYGYFVAANLPALAGVPSRCMPNNLPENYPVIQISAYASQVNALSGDLLGSQFIGGSSLAASGIALVGSTLWIAGGTGRADFPFTPNALMPANLGSAPMAGTYLGAVDFSQPQPPAGSPKIGCIVDSAALAPVGVAAPYQLVTIFGSGLGPANGVSGADDSTITLGGVSINVGGISAPLLYASSTQINFAVPQPASGQTSSTMQLTVNNLDAPARQFPLTALSPSLFLDTVQTYQANSPGFIALALNADGSVNSSTNPAPMGSAVSVFVNGVSMGTASTPHQFGTNSGWLVTDSVQSGPFVVRVDLQVPSQLGSSLACGPSLCMASFEIYDVNAVPLGSEIIQSASGPALGGIVYVRPNQ
jgi:uncharacterized protein (TIGR03437 family)